MYDSYMDILKVSAGNPPKEINVFVEIPQGSSIKYELDKESGALVVDRFIHTAMVYPFNYGFVPHTHADDGDPIDVLLISDPVYPGSVVLSRPIGVLEMEDEAGMDLKIIAVPVSKIDPAYTEIKEITDLDVSTRSKIEHFFNRYKELEPGKWVKIRRFLGRKEAEEAIKTSLLPLQKKIA